MRFRRATRLALSAVLACLLLPGSHTSAQAPLPSASTGVTSGSCRVAALLDRGLDVICEPGFATARDRVLVYRRTAAPAVPPVVGAPWQSEMRDEVWLLDPGARGRTGLVIDFRSAGESAIARVYDDGDGDGSVSIDLRDGVPVVTERNGHPPLQLTAVGGWRLPSGAWNFNLDVVLDGAITATVDAPAYLALLQTDGRPDLTAHIRDPERVGRPRLEWRQARPPLPESASYYRTSIMVNTLGDEVPLAPAALPWPYLGDDLAGLVKPYFRSPAPVQVDWVRLRIVTLGEFVASRAKPGNYFIYSLNRVAEGAVTETNFESPFGFYRLGNDPSRLPDLVVRVAHFGAHDRFVTYPVPTQQVDFSWRQAGVVDAGAPVWDFKVSVAGRHRMEETVNLGPFGVRIVPYERLPSWVASQTWDFATLVAREGTSYPSTEGMYEWYPLEAAEPDARRYLSGLSDKIPTTPFQDVPPFHRAELTLALQDRPTLYLSAVDHKLHLSGSDRGVWNVGDGRHVRTTRRNSRYVDEWVLEDGGRVTTLWLAGDQLILSGPDGVRLKSMGAGPTLFEAALPATEADWRRLETLLAAHRAAAPPPPTDADVATLFARMPGPELVLPGAAARDARVEGDGNVRFALSVDGSPSPNAQWANGLTPGSHVVTYRGGAFTVTPLTAPELRLEALTTQATAARPLEPLRVTATVRNLGTEAAAGARVRLIPFLESQSHSVVDTAPPPEARVDVPGLGSAQVSVTWIPPADGRWTLRASLDGAPAQEAGPTLDLSVARPLPVSSALVGAQGFGGADLAVTGAVMLAVATLAGWIGHLLWRARR